MSGSPPAVSPPAKSAPAAARPSRKRRSALRDRAELLLFHVAAGGLALLPPAAARRVGRAAARAAFSLLSSRRRILLRNLAAAYPDDPTEQIVSIAAASIAGFASALVDFLQTGRMSRDDLLSRVSIVGEENLRAARARGKGVFLLSAHFGSWEIGALAAGLLGEPIAPVVRPLDNPLLEEELGRLRRRFGNRPVPKKQASRELLRAMSRNETVAILVDQNVLPREAVFVPFFGRPAATTPSLALLQLKTGAAVVPVFTWPEADGRYRLAFEPPILPEEFEGAGADREERVRRATARYMAVTEAAVRKDPAAWLWVHNRWKTQPLETPR
jgi:KDO2-lipid IV(A) lauroyltransferase